jgi:hypothetical protein
VHREQWLGGGKSWSDRIVPILSGSSSFDEVLVSISLGPRLAARQVDKLRFLCRFCTARIVRFRKLVLIELFAVIQVDDKRSLNKAQRLSPKRLELCGEEVPTLDGGRA